MFIESATSFTWILTLNISGKLNGTPYQTSVRLVLKNILHSCDVDDSCQGIVEGISVLKRKNLQKLHGHLNIVGDITAGNCVRKIHYLCTLELCRNHQYSMTKVLEESSVH